MSLKGSLQTVALPEVLNFLSSTGKTGEFHVSGASGEGRLWFDEGRIGAFRAGMSEQPFEAVFELLRIGDGEFTFAAGAERPDDAHSVDGEPAEVAPAIEAAEARLGEWREIVAVVPSLVHRVQLRTEVPEHRIELEPEQWPMVVAVASGHTVGDVLSSLGLREFDGCRAMRTLVDSSLVEVLEPAEPVVFDTEPVIEEPVADEPVVADIYAEEPVVADLYAEPVLGGSFEPVEEPVAGESFEPVEVLGGEEETPSDPTPGFGFGFGLGFGQPATQVDFDGAHSTDEHDELNAVEEPAEVVTAEHSDEELPATDPEGDHYAALRAAMVEIGENLVPDEVISDQEPDDEHFGGRVYEVESDPELDGRAALQALLSEVTAGDNGAGYAASDEPVDALADRGPWTQHELSTMESQQGWNEGTASQNGWTEPVETPSNVVPFAPVHGADTGPIEGSGEAGEGDEADDEEAQPAEEPINRGLLLKFLSSVRN